MTSDYRICSRCVMDTTASDITFDHSGVCNYCEQFVRRLDRHFGADRQKRLEIILTDIKASGTRSDYDCIVGVSGGLDSSFTLYQAKRHGLRPLAVHLDNGWNSETAVNNIENLVKKLNIDLHTHVIDWEEFKNLQKAFFAAHVIDIELLTDHAILSTLYKTAHRFGVKYIIAGTNIANEGMRIPPLWNHFKFDYTNIKTIHKRFGNGKRMKTFPCMPLYEYFYYTLAYKARWISLLDYIDYNNSEALRVLKDEIGYHPHEKKHYESIFTRFYQGYILPKKFNVDKRKVHYSALICSGQMERKEAIQDIQGEPYKDLGLLESDREYVLKKLGMSIEYFNTYLSTPPIMHTQYPSDKWALDLFRKFAKHTRIRLPVW